QPFGGLLEAAPHAVAREGARHRVLVALREHHAVLGQTAEFADRGAEQALALAIRVVVRRVDLPERRGQNRFRQVQIRPRALAEAGGADGDGFEGDHASMLSVFAWRRDNPRRSAERPPVRERPAARVPTPSTTPGIAATLNLRAPPGRLRPPPPP